MFALRVILVQITYLLLISCNFTTDDKYAESLFEFNMMETSCEIQPPSDNYLKYGEEVDTHIIARLYLTIRSQPHITRCTPSLPDSDVRVYSIAETKESWVYDIVIPKTYEGVWFYIDATSDILSKNSHLKSAYRRLRLSNTGTPNGKCDIYGTASLQPTSLP